MNPALGTPQTVTPQVNQFAACRVSRGRRADADEAAAADAGTRAHAAMAPSKLKDFIQTVRACKVRRTHGKATRSGARSGALTAVCTRPSQRGRLSSQTAAEEREAIAKESATIRTSFKDDNNDYRHRNVAKLLYIHMLGMTLFLQGRRAHCRRLMFRAAQTAQAAAAAGIRIPGPVRPGGMCEARGVAQVCRQAARLPGHHAPAGREPGGPDARDQLAQKVRRRGRRYSVHAEKAQHALTPARRRLHAAARCAASDLNHPNVYVNGLALATLGNISSQEMARDLATEVEKLIGSQSAYVRKKVAHARALHAGPLPGRGSREWGTASCFRDASQAYLCAVRIIRKVPELYENFVARAKNVFQERNHATLLTGLTLIQELLHVDPSLVEQFRSVRRGRHYIRSGLRRVRSHAHARRGGGKSRWLAAGTGRAGPDQADEGAQHGVGLLGARDRRHRRPVPPGTPAALDLDSRGEGKRCSPSRGAAVAQLRALHREHRSRFCG